MRAKERALRRPDRRDGALSRWKRVADLWCAAWFAAADAAPPPSAFGSLVRRGAYGRGALPSQTARRATRRRPTRSARARRLFHWELEFPEVFFDATARDAAMRGFDAVIGNPPWDMIRADAGCAPTTRSRGAAST